MSLGAQTPELQNITTGYIRYVCEQPTSHFVHVKKCNSLAYPAVKNVAKVLERGTISNFAKFIVS